MTAVIPFAKRGDDHGRCELALGAWQPHGDDDARNGDDEGFNDYSLLLPSPTHSHHPDAPFSHRSSLRFSIVSTLYRRRRIVFLFVLTVFWTCALIAYFAFPSTLHLYLATLLYTLPVSFIIDLYALIVERGQSWSRPRTASFAFSALGVSSLFLMALIPPFNLDANATLPIPDLPRDQTYYIASNLYNSESLLPHYTSSLHSLISVLGEQNVFVSIYESNSKDRTKELLASFDGELAARGVRRRIKTDDAGKGARRDKGHWNATLDRINYLARVRNEALTPLYEGMEGLEVGEFSRVVWLNDVYFDWRSVLHLLNTHNGSYDLACAFDYSPLGLYDTWVTRDLCGDRVKPLWPYFSHADDVTRLARKEPIPVNSCWNGIAAFDARWFLPRSTSAETSDELPSPFTPSAADSATDAFANSTIAPPAFPLRFRSQASCDSSECLLTSFDMHRLSAPARPRIYMNPLVTATYDYPSHLLYTHILNWRIVAPWRALWQDLVSHRMFGWVTDIGRKKAVCKTTQKGWAEPPLGRVCPQID